MKNKLMTLGALAALAVAGVALPAAANAQDWHGGGHRYYNGGGYYHGGGGYYHGGGRGYWHNGVWVNLGGAYPAPYYQPVAYYPPVYQQPVAYYPQPAPVYYGGGPALGLSFHIR